jgi:hypothetical protein
MVEEPPVPDLPEPNDLPTGTDGQPLGGEARWTRYTGAHRACDRCIRAINQKVMHTHPHPARRKRTGPTSEPEFLCLQHAEKQETRDQMVTRKLEALRKSQTKKAR